jgi:hypothetical protein
MSGANNHEVKYSSGRRNIFPYLTRVERSNVITAQALEHSKGKPSLLPNVEPYPDYEIAVATHELHAGLLDDKFSIIRKYPAAPILLADGTLAMMPEEKYTPYVIKLKDLILKNDY